MAITRGIYVCLFSTGVVKVGKGVNIESRITSHIASAKNFGVSLTQSWMFPCGGIADAEKALLQWCKAEAASVSSKEWFHGLDVALCNEEAQKIAAQFKERPVEKLDLAFDGIISHWNQKGETPDSIAYLNGRQMTAAAGVLSDESFKIMDALHYLCEYVRKQNSSFNVAYPDWFKSLNCSASWESELEESEGLPSEELVDRINGAIKTIWESV